MFPVEMVSGQVGYVFPAGVRSGQIGLLQVNQGQENCQIYNFKMLGSKKHFLGWVKKYSGHSLVKKYAWVTFLGPYKKQA